MIAKKRLCLITKVMKTNDDFFGIEDMKTMEELEIITMDDENPDESVDEDILFDPAASLDLSPEKDE